MSFFALLPHIWVLFMVGIVVATIVMVVRSRPKKVPKNSPVAAASTADPDGFGSPDPVLDFGDELAQMENK
jgi:hypothetical protein